MKKVTKHSLWLSCLSIVLCVVMLTGTTLAWFTDNVTNSGNKIQSGTLDISLWEKQDGVYKDISASTTPLFDYDKWEPGFTASRDLQLQTAGTLALRYQVVFKGLDQMTASQTDLAKNLEVTLNSQNVGVLNDFASTTDALMAGTLVPQENKTSADMAIQIHMPETLGNEYQGIALPDFDIEINAAQYTYEEDDMVGNQYDANATPIFSIVAKGMLNTGAGVTAGVVSVSAPAIDTPVVLSVKPAAAPAGITVKTEQNSVTYEVSLTDTQGDEVASGDTPVSVSLNIGKGLSNVKIYHNDVLVDGTTYDPTTGIVTFTATSFSPYTAVYTPVGGYTHVSNETELVASLLAGNRTMLDKDIKLASRLEITDSATISGGADKHSLICGDASDRTIHLIGTTDATVTLENLKVVGPTAGTYTRGLNIGDSSAHNNNLTINLSNVEISCNYYALNITSSNDNGLKINITNSTMSGYAACNVFSNTTLNASGSTFVGINTSGQGQNDFAAIVINTNGGEGSSFTLNRCQIKAQQLADGASEFLASLRTADCTVHCTGCEYYFNGKSIKTAELGNYVECPSADSITID